MLTMQAKSFSMEYEPEKCALAVMTKRDTWRWVGNASISFANGTKRLFREADCCEIEFHTNAMAEWVLSVYRFDKITVTTKIYVDRTQDDALFEVKMEGDEFGEIVRIDWPCAFDFSDTKKGDYTVIPRRQGLLVPHDMEVLVPQEAATGGEAYISMFGQVRDGGGYCAMFETPCDARYATDGKNVFPYFTTSLGRMRYPRSLRYKFYERCSYVTFCKFYRERKKQTGEFVSLQEKIAKNANVARLIGSSVVHMVCWRHVTETSDFFDKEHPEKNDEVETFGGLGARLERLYSLGLRNAYVHIDGWGKNGYDNSHPDVFPPAECAGGTEGMKALGKLCKGLNYTFGIHDNYHDYYVDAETYDEKNAVVLQNGETFSCSIWYGGKHNYLCESLAPAYVKRNYQAFKELGIDIQGSYIDVFSIIELDECFNPFHEMTRTECLAYRKECYNVLTEQGIIPSSEEAMDGVVPAIALVHHAPYAQIQQGGFSDCSGIPVPLFSLIYHDCLVVPWGGLEGKGGWGIPKSDWGFLHGLLNGGIAGFFDNENENTVALSQILSALHKKVGLLELVNHEFIDGNVRRQRSTFADGTTVEVDFDRNEYEIHYGK